MFWIKKIISQLLMPVPLTLILLLIAIMILRRRKLVKSLMVSACLLLLFCSSQWGSYWMASSLESQYAVNNQAMGAGCVVMVLGSAHDSTINASATQQLSATALARLTEGVRQLTLGPNCQLVVSGWRGGDEVAQAQVMAQAAIELGVDAARIIRLPLAKDTLEEAQHLQWEIGNVPFRLVTSATHLPRAMQIFTQAGTQPQPAPANFIARRGYVWQFDAKNLLISQRAIHEYLGLLWLKIKSAVAGDV